MPRVARVGDIIRITNVNCSEFKGERQYNANLCNFHNKSNWAVFPGNIDEKPKSDDFINLDKKEESGKKMDPYTPTSFSGDAFAWHEEEKERIDALRKWAKAYFSEFSPHESETNLPGRSRTKDDTFYYKDFDIQGKVTDI